jgi:hypothetical protein
MTTESDAGPASGSRLGGLWSTIALLAAMPATFLLLAAIGAGEAQRGERVLGLVDPALEAVRQLGARTLMWLSAYTTHIGWVVTAGATAIALGGLLSGGKRALPLIPLALGVCAATWGQILLLGDRLQLGALLYGCGVACAVVSGLTDPMPRLAGFPRLPVPMDRGPATRSAEESALRMPWSWECLLIFLLFFVATCMRLYALTEMPTGFDLETIGFMVQSRTLHGLRHYLQFDFLSNAPGIVHLLTHAALFRLFGTSVYTVRLTSTFFGVAAVPLFYWLVRRIAGVGPAIVSTVLFIAAPEQLFWSRTEDSWYAPVAVVALITAHLGLWMIERLSFAAVLATAVWMPACRYFYVPSMIMFAYPLMLYAHASVFVRGAWRKAWYVVPVLGAGLAAWIFSLSILCAYVNGWGWRFVNPTIVYGAPAWRKHGEFRDASPAQLARLQTVSAATNLGLLLQGMVETDRFPTHWYVRYTVGKNSSLNVGFAVVLALGVGYLAGQLYERRAAVLLLWFALGLLPACLSNAATARRMALAFPAAEAIAGVMLAVLVRIVRARAERRLARITTVLVGIAVIGIVWTSLASHFLIGMAPAAWMERARFAQPAFGESDMVLTDVLEPKLRSALLLGNLDRFVQAPPCWQYIGPREWPAAALRPRCDFTDEAYAWTMRPEHVAALRTAYHPQRISYVLEQTASGSPHVSLLRALYPSVVTREYQDGSGQPGLVVITVDLSGVTALHSLSLRGALPPADGQGVQSDLLANVPVVLSPAVVSNPGLALQGGVLVERDGWYRFAVEPGCSQAGLRVDGHSFSPSDERPMLAGVHALELTVPSATACLLPLRVLVQSGTERMTASLTADLFVTPAVAAVSQVQAPPVVTYAGYGETTVFAQFKGMPVAFGADGSGYISVLVVELGAWRMHRFDPAGREEATWPLPIAADPNSVKMVVAADGTCIVAAEARVLLYDRSGKSIGAWSNDLPELPVEIALWHKDEILIAVPRRDAIMLVTRDGKVQRVLTEFEGGPGRFHRPIAVSASAAGDILVVEDSGQALLFRNSGQIWDPQFIRAFAVDFASLPPQTGASAFDEQSRVLVPDRSTTAPLVYTLDGERMLAARPERDLSTRGFTHLAALQPAGDRLYALDRGAQRLWAISR